MSDPGGGSRAGGLLDDADRRVLAGLAAAWQAHDPVPDGLVADVTFAVACHALGVEVGGILAGVESSAAAAGTVALRSDDEVRTLTFTTPRTTIMVHVTRTGDGRQRLDGWVEPVTAGSVRLHVRASTHDAVLSVTGRFEFADLAPGTMRLVLLDDDGAPTTVTPAFEW